MSTEYRALGGPEGVQEHNAGRPRRSRRVAALESGVSRRQASGRSGIEAERPSPEGDRPREAGQRPILFQFLSENNIHGTTLLELLVAIAVAGVAIVLIFAFYTNVVKGYWLHEKRSEAVKEMIVARLAIKRHFANVEKVVSCRKEGFDYVKAETDSIRTVRFEQNTLLDNTDTIIKNITSFACQTVMPDEKQQGRGVLLWEVVAGKGNWVAGAKETVFNGP